MYINSSLQSTNLKPTACGGCPFENQTYGFVPVAGPSPSQAKFAVLLDSPGETDVQKQLPLAGETGSRFDHVLSELNISRNDIIIDNVLRCRSTTYPTGPTKYNIEHHCRRYDTIIDEFNPDVVILSYSPKYALMSVPSETYTIYDCLKKAINLSALKHRPLIAMGENVKNLLFPKLPGDVSIWARKHFFVRWVPAGFANYKELLKARAEPKKLSWDEFVKAAR